MHNTGYKVWTYGVLLFVTVIFHMLMYFIFYKKVLKAELLWHTMSINRLRLLPNKTGTSGPPISKASTVLGLENNDILVQNIGRGANSQTTGSLEVRKVSPNQIRVGDIVMIKAGTVAPADVLIIDTSASLHSEKIFHVSERKVTGDSGMMAKFAVRNLNEDSEIKPENINPGIDQLTLDIKEGDNRTRTPKQGSAKVLKEAEKLIKKMTGLIEYDAPNPRSEFAGTFKLRSDHKISRFGRDNVMFCGTKLHTGWVIGMVIYSGINTKIMQKNITEFKFWQALRLTKKSSAEKIIDIICWTMLGAGLIYSVAVTLVGLSAEVGGLFRTLKRVQPFPLCVEDSCSFTAYLVILSTCLELVPIGLPLAKDIVCSYYALDAEGWFKKASRYLNRKFRCMNCVRRFCPKKSTHSKAQASGVRDWSGVNIEYRGAAGSALSKNSVIKARGAGIQTSPLPFGGIRAQNGQKLFRATSISHRKEEPSDQDLPWLSLHSNSQRQPRLRPQPSMIYSQNHGSTFISPDSGGDEIQTTPLPLESTGHNHFKKFQMPSMDDLKGHPSTYLSGQAEFNHTSETEEGEDSNTDQEPIKIVRFNLMSELGHLDHVIFDKTDTLTTGVFNVAKISTASRGYLLEPHLLAEKMMEARSPGNKLLIQNESVDEVENMHNSGYSEKSQE